MTTPTTDGVWMTPQARERLEAELAELMSHREFDTEDPNDRDDQLVEAQLARKARIRQIHELLSNAVVGDTPPDDGIAEPGMVLTVRYDDTGDTETFLLGVRGAEDADIEVYSVQSPLGSALAGARPGEQRSYTLPNGAEQPVTLISAVPYGAHVAGK
ncbi:GreA/GreB family elongation factor [Mycolicibacterium sp. XJ1819]